RREREDARRSVPLSDREGPTSRARASGDDARAAEASERAREGAGRAPPARRPILPTTLRARGARSILLVTEVDTKTRVDKGTRVRVLAGPFANKIGIVEE